MEKPAHLSFKIDRRLYQQATDVLAEMGLTPIAITRALLLKIVNERRIPFEISAPKQQ